ncbi:MAG: hypothetical protein K2F87_00140 [Muribaculaceae bacterium]|nr:hypothetical protein [Muribaculaceae bacterium]
MSETLNIASQTALTAVGEADRLYVESGGQLRPVTVATLAAELRQSMQLSRTSSIKLTGGEWVRVARMTGTASCIMMVTHYWDTGRSVPLICAVNGSRTLEGACHAEVLTHSPWYAVNTASNMGASFTAMRFINEDGKGYIEVRFKEGSRTMSINVSTVAPVNIVLIDATVSTAAASSVLNTVQFLGG